MKYRKFVKLLLKQLSPATGAHKRHIIHFRTSRAYRHILQLLRRSKIPTPQSIVPLDMIHALSCTIHIQGKLAAYPFIRNIETDRKMKVNSLSNPSSSTQPSFIPWGIRRIKVHQAWKHTTGSRIGVAVIDTGIDYNHPDLRDSIGKGINLVNYNHPPFDDNGHGTHIAGTIAATGKGMIGVAPKAIIHPVKAFDYEGSAFVSDIIYGMDWCVKNKIPIINMSFGMKKYSQALDEAVKKAYHAGTVIVASSGNDGRRGHVDFPASHKCSISVGATDEQKKIASFSNKGEQIDIYAPGHQILSTWPSGKYHRLSGTSMATSHVSGVIALMMARKQSLSPYEIKKILQTQATPLPQSRKQKKVIYEVNALKTIHSLLKSR